jgi:hypothetical protein
MFDATFRKVASADELTSEEYVALLYATVLQQVPDPDGLAFWTRRLVSGGLAREDLVAALTGARSTPPL